MKAAIAFIALLLLATCVQAQHHHQSPGSASGSGFLNNGWNNGGYGEIGSFGRPVRYEPPRNFAIVYAKNDGEYIPSTYMNYEDALALGKQQLAAAQQATQADASLSLGEVARTLRAAKVPTLRLQVRVTQDNSGRLQICNLNGNDCHRP